MIFFNYVLFIILFFALGWAQKEKCDIDYIDECIKNSKFCHWNSF